MKKFTIDSNFDSGQIEIVNIDNPSDIQLNIAKDNASDFFQWFHFSLNGEVL